MQTFGKKLSKILLDKEISQTDLADKIGVTRQTINNTLKGRTDIDTTLVNIAMALGMTVDDLISGTDLLPANATINENKSLGNIENQQGMNDTSITYTNQTNLADRLSMALLNFSENDRIRAENEKKLIEQTQQLLKLLESLKQKE